MNARNLTEAKQGLMNGAWPNNKTLYFDLVLLIPPQVFLPVWGSSGLARRPRGWASVRWEHQF